MGKEGWMQAVGLAQYRPWQTDMEMVVPQGDIHTYLGEEASGMKGCSMFRTRFGSAVPATGIRRRAREAECLMAGVNYMPD